MHETPNTANSIFFFQTLPKTLKHFPEAIVSARPFFFFSQIKSRFFSILFVRQKSSTTTR